MKTAHTPGPWSVGQTREAHGYPTKAVETLVCVGEGATQGNAIARVGLGGPGAMRYTAESVEANARLIAASPALFDLLKEALAQSGCDGDLCAYEWHEKARRLLNEITEGNP